ncbi:MAG: hypothetical protein ACREXX_21680 [Gammaproteobacteria bacterium]
MLDEFMQTAAAMPGGGAVDDLIPEGEVVSVVQTVDHHSRVIGQVLYYKDGRTPQYMVDVRDKIRNPVHAGVRSKDNIDIIGITEDSLGG